MVNYQLGKTGENHLASSDDTSAGMLCPHCAKIISSPTPTCPYCAMPLDELIQMEAAPEFKHQRWRWLLHPRTIIVSVVTVAVVLGLYGFIVLQQYSNKQYIATADRFMTEGNTSAAAEYYRKAVQFGSQDPNLYEKLGWVEYQLARDADALKNFESAVSLQPDRVASLYGAGLAAYQLRDYQKSISFLEHVIEIEPRYADAYEYLGLAEYRLRKYELAYEHLNRAWIYNPQNATTAYYLARILVITGEARLAIYNFDQAEDLGFDPGAIAYARGLAWIQEGNYESARDDLQNALMAFPARADVILSLAKTFYLLDDFSAAKTQLTTMQTNIPHSLQPEYLALSGWISLRQGYTTAARDTFNLWLVLEPNNEQVLNSLGWAAHYSGDCQTADSYFESAVQSLQGEWVFSSVSLFEPEESPKAGLEIQCQDG